MAEIDQSMSNGKHWVMGVMGPDGMKKADEIGGGVRRVGCEQSVPIQSGKMSYAPPSWVKEDPEFWAP